MAVQKRSRESIQQLLSLTQSGGLSGHQLSDWHCHPWSCAASADKNKVLVG